MGIADDGAIGPHIDFTGRLTQYTTNFNLSNTHGDMVAGIAIGSGNLDPRVMGMAHRTYLHMYGINGYPHVVPAVNNYNTLGTTITSTSYSQGTGGVYTADAATIRRQAGLCLKRVDLSRRIRLLGVRVGALVKAGTAPAAVLAQEPAGYPLQTPLFFTDD
jgi:hypothetical protein